MLRGNMEDGNTLKALEIMENSLLVKPVLDAASLNNEATAVFVIDMLEGFARDGSLSDRRIEMLAEPIAELLEVLPLSNIVFMNDSHGEDSIEFEAYPSHCIKGTAEAEIVRELRGYSKNGIVMEKNSTNGFVCGDFGKWFEENRNTISTYLVVGDCTDICVKQFAMTLKAWFSERNIDSRVIVAMNMVDTFDLEATGHNGDLMNVVSLYEMDGAGIEIVYIRLGKNDNT